MSFAETDKRVLEGLTASLKKWVALSFKDPVNEALNLRAVILKEDLPELRRIRWYTVKDLVEVQKVWLRYIENETHEGEMKQSLYDFYMNGATYLWLQNPTASAHYESFISHLATTLAWAKRCQAIPADSREYMGNSEELTALLKNNHWLVFMVLLSVTDIEQ